MEHKKAKAIRVYGHKVAHTSKKHARILAKAAYRHGKTGAKHTARLSKTSARHIAKGYRVAHYHAAQRPHQKLVQKVGWYRRWHEWRWHKIVHTGFVVVYLVAIVVIGFKFMPIARALSTWMQTDWSGGTGSSTSNQYESASNIVTSTPGQLTLDTATISDWCNNASCNNSWTRRKKVIINSGSDATNVVVRFNVSYDSDMQADFDDLRFTATDGTELPYFIESKTNSSTAAVAVKVNSVSTGVNTIYAYYGNGAAASTSDANQVYDVYDTFSGGSLDGAIWGNGANPTVSGGKLILNGGQSIWSNFQGDFSTTRVYQWDVNYISDFCNGGYSPTFKMGTYYFDYFVTNGYTCSPGALYNLDAYDENGSPQNGITGLTNIPITTTRTYKIVIKTDKTAEYYYSTDGGINFTQLSVSSPGGSGALVNYFYFESSNGPLELDNIISYSGVTGVDVSHIGIEEQQGGKVGSLTSAIFDAGAGAFYDTVSWNTSGTGIVGVAARSSNDSGMSGATDMDLCNVLSNDENLSDSNCIHPGQRYVQYRVYLSDGSVSTLNLADISLSYGNDATSPPTNASSIVMKRTVSGDTITTGWTNNNSPYFSWTAGADNGGGSGIKGYCVYLGTDQTGDPISTKGEITDSSPVDSNGTCQYITTSTDLDFASIGHNSLSNDTTYYLNIKAIDNVNNVFDGSSAQYTFGYDDGNPDSPVNFNGPATWVNSKIFHLSWTGFDLGGYILPGDPGSGLLGLQYCITNADLGFSGCQKLDSNWYGAAHTGSLTDVIPADNSGSGGFDTVPADASRIKDNGQSIIFIRPVDRAGNTYGQGIFATVSYGTTPPTIPQNLNVTPNTNSENNFSFSWNAPTTYIGQASGINYCWTVNVAPAANTCTFAGAGITSLSAGAYATQPGLNTMYVVARDEAGNIDYNNKASVTFTANTAAPGAPRDFTVIDASIKSTSTWKLALSWAPPSLPGSGVHHYKIYRSNDNVSFSEVGSTTSTSFVDGDLNQQRYYYYVKACDNANNCGAASNTDDDTPTGHFTSPAGLVANPKVSGINTRRATVSWVTDRTSDTRVQYGTSSGHYFSTEAAISTQTTDHSIEINGLSSGTTYFFKAKWTDEDGNVGTSPEYSFTTAPAPQIREVSASDINISSVNINFTSIGASHVKLLYGKSDGFGGLKQLNTSTAQSHYSQALTGLDDGTKYFYKLNPIDSDGNEYDGNVYSFTTPARPHISNLRFQPVTGEPTSTQKVTWSTNVPANSQLSYGGVGQPTKEAISSTMTTEHELTIHDLVDNTEYSLIASSRDASGNIATSDRQTFHTALDTRPPKASAITVEASVKGNGNESHGQLVVSWKTDEPATSQVAFGVGNGNDLNSKTTEDSRLTTDHVVIISDLSTSQVYSVQAISRDKASNSVTSEKRSAIVGRASDSVLSIIFNVLQQIFGFK